MRPLVLLLLVMPFSVAQAGLSDLEKNMSRPGGDFINFHTRNAKSCADECRRDSRCRAFTFNQDKKHCWLKDRVPEARHKNRSVSGVKGGHHEGGQAGNHVNGVSIERNSDRKGSDYRDLYTNNAKACARHCSKESRCRAFAYWTREQRCWLKDRVPARYNLSNSVSGVKQSSAVPGEGQGNLPSRVGRVRIERHSDRRGSDYRNQRTSDAVACARLCDREKRCRSFAYQTGSKHCWLKDRVANHSKAENSVSGIKRDGRQNDDYPNSYRDDYDERSTGSEWDQPL